ncbi:hypothetical protein JTE90_006996 [Oedothorax gibbosus]|uniref:Uncharacterized protein n=1 Tax=Oedothorax gibbosus TaxID=931172 RepID=A0AAV6V8U5_9ARAC|nr:hypothetical protein JTE90_006996 [Oedothorax gibbosus]
MFSDRSPRSALEDARHRILQKAKIKTLMVTTDRSHCPHVRGLLDPLLRHHDHPFISSAGRGTRPESADFRILFRQQHGHAQPPDLRGFPPEAKDPEKDVCE